MDSIKMEKLQAMAKYKKTQFHFLRQLTKYALCVILLGSFLSCPLWLHPLSSCFKSFAFVSVPKAITYVLRPNILFVISNIIVFILVGESKLLGSPNSAPDIYDKYVKRKKRYNQRPIVPAAAEKEVCYEEDMVEKPIVKVKSMEDTEKGEKENGDEDGDEMEAEESMEDLEEEEEEEEQEIEAKTGMDELEEEVEAKEGVEELEEEEEEDCGLPVAELNKRAEEFIAKFNHQRRIEARMLFCSG